MTFIRRRPALALAIATVLASKFGGDGGAGGFPFVGNRVELPVENAVVIGVQFLLLGIMHIQKINKRFVHS